MQPDGSWWLNNAGAIHADGEVVLVDTCANRDRTTRFLAAVAEKTGDAPIRVALNTHLHGDHVYGNVLLPDTTVIVGHTNTRQGVLDDFLLRNTPPVWSPTPNWEITELRPPTLTFSSSVSVYAGTTEIVLRHPGYTAHTVGDVVAWLPDSGVLFTGDLVFNGVTPLVAMGSLTGAQRSVDWLRTFPVTHVVPGHGPLIPATIFPEVLDTHARYYQLVLDTARDGMTRGLSPLEAGLACDLGEFKDLPDQERMVLNLHRAYAEITETPMDLLKAMADAVTYNKGPLHCAL
ncbi:MBL fold metallo-hydrolase [Kibdelosporangium lantanae]